MGLVFVHLPRTGGTSISLYLLACGMPVRNIVHNAARGTCSLGCCWISGGPIVPLPQDPYFFGFVRNPWSWYVSRYAYFKRQHLTEQGVSRRCELGVRNSSQLSFRDHLLSHKEDDWFWMTHRYLHLFCDERDKLLLSYVGRTESIDAGIADVFSFHGLQPKMTYTAWDEKNREKRNKSVHEHYSTYYDDELLSLVAGKDRLLISTYGYKFKTD